MKSSQESEAELTLVVRKTIDGDAEAVFRAWAEPEHIVKWWGPAHVTCSDCTVDLRVGGSYRIANRFADGSILWIRGEFERIDPPNLLVYSWCTEPATTQPGGLSERVSVRFVDNSGKTEVIVEHSRIPSPSVQEGHEAGWIGCLEGLRTYLE